MWYTNIKDHPNLRSWYTRVESRPGWVWKTAVVLGVLVIVLPLALLAIGAMLVMAAAFAVLSLVAAGLASIRSLLGGPGANSGWSMPRDDGRRNVRVIHRP